MAILYTSLAEIYSHNPCAEGWKNILKGQNKRKADDEKFPLVDCLNSNSFSNVCWLLKYDTIAAKYIFPRAAKLCANSVQHLSNRPDAAYINATAADAYATAADATAATDDAAADAAADAADAGAYATAAYIDAYDKQKELNKQLLKQAIEEYQNGNS